MLKTAIVFLSLFVFLSGCYSAGNRQKTKGITALTYHAGNDVFTLKKECVNDISISDYGVALFLNIKNSNDCAVSFDSFFRDNVGKDVDVNFNNVTVTDRTKIVSPIILKNGFHQHVTDSADATKIIHYYKK